MPNTFQKFGVGTMIATTRTDSQGNILAVPASYRIGILQDVTTDFSFETKTLHGENVLALDRGRGKGKLTFSAKTASIDVAAFNALHFGVSATPGFRGPATDVPATNAGSGSFGATPTPPLGGTWVADLGVRDLLGNTYTRVLSNPTDSQYTVNNGAYGFTSTHAGQAMLFSFEYTTTTGITMPLTNQLMGYAPSFKVMLVNNSKGSRMVLSLSNCQSDKLSIPFKNEDFAQADFGFEALDDGTGFAGFWAQA